MGNSGQPGSAELLSLFLADCQEAGMAARTVSWYQGYLAHLVSAFKYPPASWPEISQYLHKRRDGVDRRGPNFKAVQAFYAFLDRAGILAPSPFPRGKIGRPGKIISQPVTDRLSAGGRRAAAAEASGTGRADQVQPLTVQEAREHFMARCEAKGLKAETVNWYEDFWTALAKAWPTIPTEPEAIDKFLGSLRHLSPERRHGYFRFLRTLYKFLAKRLSYPNPIDQVDAPKVPRKTRPTLSMEEARAVLGADLPPRERAMISLLFVNGVRSGELCSLDAEGIGDGFITVSGKTGQRIVPISAEVGELLKDLATTGPVFLGRRGRMTPCGIYQIIRPILEGLGITKRHMGPHLLRHTFAQKFLEQGGDLMSLKQTLGHTQVSTTAIYGEQTMGAVQKKVEQLSLFSTLQREGK